MKKNFQVEVLEEFDEKNYTEKIEDNAEKGKSSLEIQKKYLGDIRNEEGALKAELEELKKKNFALEIGIKAWQTTLKNKTEEYKQIEKKLAEKHAEIWSKREEFCRRADVFGSEFGILSPWWSTQLNYVTQSINFKEGTMEEVKEQENIELQQEIDRLKKELEDLEKRESEIESKEPEWESSQPSGKEENILTEIMPEEKEKEDLPVPLSLQMLSSTSELYSLMDAKRLKMANRKKSLSKNRRLQCPNENTI